MNPNNPTLVSSSRSSQARSRLLPFTASRVGKLAACLILGVAMLPQSARSADYATSALANNPAAFWQLNETGDPLPGTLPASDSSSNGLHGTYGTASQNGFNNILSPQPPTYQGFATNQGALRSAASDVTSVVTLPSLNLSSNVVDTTIAMWINPTAQPPTDGGLLFDRSGGAATAGFGFQGQNAGLTRLGYNWNDANWGYNSGLYPPLNEWSFVALVVETNRATIYLCYIDSGSGQPVLSSAVNNATHSAVTWSGAGPRWLGGDNNNANRTFPGDIAGAAVYNTALTADQILAMFAGGVGVTGFSPSISQHPQSRYVLSGSPVQMRATVNGTSPLAYQWQLNGTNVNLLPNSANYTGANLNVLTILSTTVAEVGSYQLIVTNLYGTALSSNALLTIQAPSLAGKWFTNNSLADVSGYQPAGTHDGFDAFGTGNYMFTNDVPTGKTGQSVYLFNGDTGIAISNSSTLDLAYANTFDERINNAMTIALWAKGWPTSWSPFASKYGEAAGWQIRQAGDNNQEPCWTIRGAGGMLTLGRLAYNNPDDLVGAGVTLQGDTNNWHLYVGTFDAVTGIRNMYVDGVLRGSENSNSVYTLSPASFLCFGARDNGGNVFVGPFNGLIYDARVYNYAISQSDVQNMYGIIPPAIASQPVSTAVFLGSKATFRVTASGTAPLNFQWQLNNTNVNLLPDAANFTGINSNILTVLSVSSNDVGSYHVVVTSALGYGTVTSSNALLAIVQKVLVGEWFTNGTWTDLSGYTPAGTHDAYAVGAGAASFSADVPPGMTGQSIQFPSSWDTGAAISNSATTDGPTYTNTFEVPELSVAFWAKGRGGPWYWGRWDAWVAKDGYNNNGEYNGIGWSVGMEAWSQHFYFDMEGIDQGGIAYTLGNGLWGNQILESSPANLPGDDNWHHYATTYSPETGVRRMYFDGTLVAEQTGNAPYNMAPDKHLTIGCQEQTTTGFTGFSQSAMFDVRIYNYALSSNEIAGLLPTPQITTQPPQARNAYVGVTTHISATVTTFNKLTTNQWQFNGTNLTDGAFGGATISGANSTTLTLSGVTTNLQGVYSLIVSYSGGMTISSNTTVTVLQTAPAPAGNLVGAWITGTASLADTSGYSPAGTHDGHGVAGTGTPSAGYSFTNDVPPGVAGQSLSLVGNTAISITNSSDLDGAYTNTFDDTINTNGMTVTCWAKGLPGGWNPWLSKYGENGAGWQLRVNGDGATPCWTIRGTGGNEDMSSTIGSVNTGWHFYAGTYSPVTGDRSLYVDGVLAATQTGQGPLNPSTSSHLVIGARDSGGNSFGNYFTGKIYGVRIYNTDLSEAQVNYFLVPAPVFIGPPVLNGNKFVLTYTGTLLSATNVAGPYLPVAGATSPYTNIITTAPQMFFRLSNP